MAVLRLVLLLLVFLHVEVLCSEAICIRHVNLDKDEVILSYSAGVGVSAGGLENVVKIPLLVSGPSFLLQSSLIAAVRFAFLKESSLSSRFFSLSVYDDLAENQERENDTLSGSAYVASLGRLFAALGSAATDVLTFGSTSVAARTNLTTIVLPFSPCPDIDQLRIHSKLFQKVLVSSGMDEDALTLEPLTGDSSVRLAQVHLFMTVALLSLFLSILLLPCLSRWFHGLLAPQLSKQTLQTAEFSLLSTASLVAGFFIFYWIISAISFYCHFSETVDGVLFSSAFFCPFTQCMIFYMLAGMASYFGGMLFSQCRVRRAHITCCEVMGKGLLSACTTAGFFHTFFLILVFFQDPVSVLSNLVVFSTVFILLYLAVFAMAEQFRKTRFQGNFILVVMMQMTLSSIYFILVVAFREITCEGDETIATGSYLCVVLVISTACVSLAVAMIVMMAKGRGGNNKDKNPKKDDPEVPKVTQKSGSPDGGGGDGETQVMVQRSARREVDLAAVAREVGFVVLIPDMVQTWQRRAKNEEASVNV